MSCFQGWNVRILSFLCTEWSDCVSTGTENVGHTHVSLSEMSAQLLTHTLLPETSLELD